MAKVTVAERVIKATRCDWLLATTNVEFTRALHNKRLTDSIFESARRLLTWSGQQHTNVLASLRPAYIRQLLGVSRQIIRRLGVNWLMTANLMPSVHLMYTRHKISKCQVYDYFEIMETQLAHGVLLWVRKKLLYLCQRPLVGSTKLKF